MSSLPHSAGNASPFGVRAPIPPPPADTPRRGEPLGFKFDPVHRGLREDVQPGRLKPIDVLVIAILLSFRRHRKDSCWACKATVAARLYRSPKTVQRSLARLEACGWIRQAAVPVPDPDEPRNRTGWRIVFTWLAGPASDFGPRPDRRNPFDRKTLRPDGGQECPPPQDQNVLPPEVKNVLPPPGPKCPPREIVVVTEMEPTEMEPTESPPEVSFPLERQRPGPDAEAVPPVPTIRAEEPPEPPAATGWVPRTMAEPPPEPATGPLAAELTAEQLDACRRALPKLTRDLVDRWLGSGEPLLIDQAMRKLQASPGSADGPARLGGALAGPPCPPPATRGDLPPDPPPAPPAADQVVAGDQVPAADPPPTPTVLQFLEGLTESQRASLDGMHRSHRAEVLEMVELGIVPMAMEEISHARPLPVEPPRFLTLEERIAALEGPLGPSELALTVRAMMVEFGDKPRSWAPWLHILGWVVARQYPAEVYLEALARARRFVSSGTDSKGRTIHCAAAYVMRTIKDALAEWDREHGVRMGGVP
jgi:hypothetical protein